MDFQLPTRPADGHKGTFGRVLIVAGSPGMSGAACLAGTSALRSGAGLVMVAVPQSIQSIVAGFEPSYTTTGLTCDTDGQLAAGAVRTVTNLAAGRDAVAVGPGLGQGSVVQDIVHSLIQNVGAPLVLDADALNCVAAGSIALHRDPATIVTPHPGEFSRLTGRSADDVQHHRQELAQEYAQQQQVVVVLKGQGTVVTDGNHVYVNQTGNSGMATGGSGDVLTGVIAALCGQGLDAYPAACLAVHAHGMAGDFGAEAGSQRGLIASDLLQWLPHAWRVLDSDTS